MGRWKIYRSLFSGYYVFLFFFSLFVCLFVCVYFPSCFLIQLFVFQESRSVQIQIILNKIFQFNLIEQQKQMLKMEKILYTFLYNLKRKVNYTVSKQFRQIDRYIHIHIMSNKNSKNNNDTQQSP